jgi:AraC family transcriptional regulator, regulatory protein of adaptative response / DNA-3-methyladenine glycosylase II
VDDDQRYQAAASKDARFDGVFFVAVTSTGIYCRPSCPAITPKRANVRFFKTAAAAQLNGFRACKRCRPDASPGSPEWNVRADVTARAMRLIADGIIDRGGVTGLATELGYEQRQVRRLLTEELGAGPLALARAQRAQTARVLIETTGLPVGDIAFAAGFSSIRQFNATMLEVFDTPPTRLREQAARRGSSSAAKNSAAKHSAAKNSAAKHGAAKAARAAPAPPPGAIRLRLAYRPPIDLPRMLAFLAARAIPGVEEAGPGTYHRVLSLQNGLALVSFRPPRGGTGSTSPAGSYVECDLELSDLRDVAAAAARCRRLLDLDADPEAVSGHLAHDPLLGPVATACPGRRSPGCVDGDEMAIRAVLGQQVSVAAARKLAGRLAALYGKPLPAPRGGLTHCFPDAATLAGVSPDDLPMPRARAKALVTLATALASGDVALHPGADRDRGAARLLELPGIGPWTASYIRMRALSDPDAFLPADAGVRRALTRLGGSVADAEAWRPWRSYATHHLWALLEDDREHTS